MNRANIFSDCTYVIETRRLVFLDPRDALLVPDLSRRGPSPTSHQIFSAVSALFAVHFLPGNRGERSSCINVFVLIAEVFGLM